MKFNFLQKFKSVSTLVLTYLMMISSAPAQDDVDFYSIAQRLVQDAQYNRALTYIKSIPEDADISKARMSLLKGIVFVNTKAFEEGRKELERALLQFKDEELKIPPEVYLYYCQSFFLQGDFTGSLKSLEKYSKELAREPKAQIIRANSLWKLDRKEEAWQIVLKGEENFPNEILFSRQKIVFMMELGLYENAFQLVLQYLVENSAPPQEFLSFAVNFRKAKQEKNSLKLFEVARLRFPRNEMILLEFANSYYEKGKLYRAAEIFEELSRRNTKYVKEASELYRRAGYPMRALALNRKIQDSETKLKQRLAIYIDQSDFELASSMEMELNNLGLGKDQDISYALAYSHFQIGKIQQSKELLRRVTREDLYRKSLALKSLMSACLDGQGACL